MPDLCPKCHYERKPSDDAPPGVCPSCGTDYERYRKAVQAQAASAAALASLRRSNRKAGPGWVLLLLLIALSLVLGYALGRLHERQVLEVALAELQQAAVLDTGLRTPGSGLESQPITALLLDKQFDDRPIEDAITFELEFENQEDRAVDEFEGILRFVDLKGKTVLGAAVAVDRRIPPRGRYRWQGEFNYVPSREEHAKLRELDVDDVRVEIEVTSVRFVD